MTDLIDTTEMYLKTIFELEEDGVVPMRARIAERLGHSGPTVSQTVARMERDGLLTLEDDRHLELTGHGRLTATRVMRKHRLAERLLVDVIGLDLSYVHDEACRWEHVMSDRVERRILELIGPVDLSPYGNPIPGLDELGVTEAALGTASGAGATGAAPATAGGAPGRSGGARSTTPGRHLVAAAGEQETELTVLRIGEPAQVDPEVLDLLAEAGVAPGRVVSVRADGDRVSVRGVGGSPVPVAVSLPHDVASHIFVRHG